MIAKLIARRLSFRSWLRTIRPGLSPSEMVAAGSPHDRLLGTHEEGIMLLDEALAMIESMPVGIDTENYNKLSGLVCRTEEISDLNRIDPFSADYRARSEALYRRISARSDYSPERDETSKIDSEAADIWRTASPFGFKSTKFVSEFLISWGAIFDALDMKEGQSVLEYGPGSGQALLMLARTGIQAHGVDIDGEGLKLLRRQSEAMGLDVSLEQAEFGHGFDGKKFDRILFFEAFHHAINFESVALKLHDKLLPGGKIVLCGEPIVGTGERSVPYPWGPRMDALSILCMRRYGWMELGFHLDFLVEALMRCGWLVTQRPSAVFRAVTYVLEPIGDTIPIGGTILLPSGWSSGEGTHRWTVAETAFVPLPATLATLVRTIEIGVVNHLPVQKTVRIECGNAVEVVTLNSGQSQTIVLHGTSAPRLQFKTNLMKPRGETRDLGVAVTHVRLNS
jgi:2-polyprenyl-3-methyl-5-hydroxy-6-metoxy-1,4-benzoquinol methylase